MLQLLKVQAPRSPISFPNAHLEDLEAVDGGAIVLLQLEELAKLPLFFAPLEAIGLGVRNVPSSERSVILYLVPNVPGPLGMEQRISECFDFQR